MGEGGQEKGGLLVRLDMEAKLRLQQQVLQRPAGLALSDAGLQGSLLLFLWEGGQRRSWLIVII